MVTKSAYRSSCIPIYTSLAHACPCGYLARVCGCVVVLVVGDVGTGSIVEPHGMWSGIVASVRMALVATELVDILWHLPLLSLQIVKWASISAGAPKDWRLISGLLG